jgi:hypothetical protein
VQTNPPSLGRVGARPYLLLPLASPNPTPTRCCLWPPQNPTPNPPPLPHGVNFSPQLHHSCTECICIGLCAGSKVLYLGAASGTSVSHVSDIVGPEGAVYAVEFSHRSGRDLVNMAKKRPNVIPIIEDARHPQKYRMLVPMVDVVFADVAQPDQVRPAETSPLGSA